MNNGLKLLFACGAPESRQVFGPLDRRRWTRGPPPLGFENATRDKGPCRSGKYNVTIVETALECARLCRRQNWCRGFGFQDGPDWKREPDFVHGACQMMEVLIPKSTGVQGILSYSMGTTSGFDLQQLGAAIIYNSNSDRLRWCRGDYARATRDGGKCAYDPSWRKYTVGNASSVYECAQLCAGSYWCVGFNCKSGAWWNDEPDFFPGACQMMAGLRPCPTGVTDLSSYALHFVTKPVTTTLTTLSPGAVSTTGAATTSPAVIAICAMASLIFLAACLISMRWLVARTKQSATMSEEPPAPVLLGQTTNPLSYLDKDLMVIRRSVTAAEIQMGVSAIYLLQIFPSEARASTSLPDPNFYQICPVLALGEKGKGFGKICPRDGRPNCSIVDALDPEHRATASHFVSWCWSYSLDVVVGAVQHWAESTPCPQEEIVLWMCFFCNNQYRIQEGLCNNSDDLSAIFAARLSSAGKMLVILDSFLEPHYYSRAWCLFETFICLQHKFPMTILLPPRELQIFRHVLESSPWQVRDRFQRIDLRNARASVQADEDAIKNLVHSSCGFDVVNSMVKDEFMAWLLRAFQEYVKGTIEHPADHLDDGSASHFSAVWPRSRDTF